VRKLFVLGLDHWIQRWQDACPERVTARKSFETAIRRLVERKRIQVVAEEAGRDEEVAANLQQEENLWALLENRQLMTTPSLKTIARTITEETNGCRHMDIRPPGKWLHPEQDGDYESAMINQTLEGIGDARRILVLCGERHRSNLSKQFVQRGWNVESHHVDDLDGQREFTDESRR
jgi:hypothetical protein